MSGRISCYACRDSGWCPLPNDDQGRPFSGACLCAKGEVLSSQLSHAQDYRGPFRYPVVVQPVPQQVFADTRRYNRDTLLECGL